ncbi:MAG: peptidoglycan DD-metalloendopeptidase family protein [Thermodesulfobacteriota bacterium]|nr:peptidoglycan DD-metalloendopeptidase family protein [Thermodesulfobacteriota bacterium]
MRIDKYKLLIFPVLIALFSCTILPRIPFYKRGVYHKIKEGQTLWTISRIYRVDLEKIADANGIKSLSQIKAGDSLFIPGAGKPLYVPKTIKKHPGYSTKPSAKAPKFIWPVKGKVLTYFGISNRIISDGIDIFAPSGTPVKAASSGTVVYAGFMKGYGNLIIIEHNDVFNTIYAQNQINLVSFGDFIKQGTIIARVGNTEQTYKKTRLHFEIRKYNKAVNPLWYIK